MGSTTDAGRDWMLGQAGSLALAPLLGPLAPIGGMVLGKIVGSLFGKSEPYNYIDGSYKPSVMDPANGYPEGGPMDMYGFAPGLHTKEWVDNAMNDQFSTSRGMQRLGPKDTYAIQQELMKRGFQPQGTWPSQIQNTQGGSMSIPYGTGTGPGGSYTFEDQQRDRDGSGTANAAANQLPAPTTSGGGSGNLLTGSAPSATTNSRSLMTLEQDATLSQLLARLNSGGTGTPYTGQLNAPQNSVQTGALQGMGGVLSNLDQNTQAYQGQLSAGNNNLQNASLTALENMANGGASQNSANQSSVKALTDFTNAGPADINDYFNSSVQNPLLKDFQTKILPQLTQRFSGQAGFGSDRQRQEQNVTNDLMQTISNSRTNMAFQAQNVANDNKIRSAGMLPGVTSAGVNDMIIMQQGGMRQNTQDQYMLDRQYEDFKRQLQGNTQNAALLGQLQTGGNIGQAAAQQPLTSQYQEFLRQQGLGQQNTANTINALNVRPFENISTVQGQQNGLLQGLLAGLGQPGGMQVASDIGGQLIKLLGGGGGSGIGDLSSGVMSLFAPELFNYAGNSGSALGDLFSGLGGANTGSGIADLFSSLFS